MSTSLSISEYAFRIVNPPFFVLAGWIPILMQNFTIAYRGILSKHEIYATWTTGRLIEEVTNLTVHKYLAGHLGGEQQLASQIEHNQIDMVIFLRDPQSPCSKAFTKSSAVARFVANGMFMCHTNGLHSSHPAHGILATEDLSKR